MKKKLTNMTQGVKKYTALLRVVVPAWDKTMANNRKLRRRHGFKVNKGEKISKMLVWSLKKAENTLQTLEQERIS